MALGSRGAEVAVITLNPRALLQKLGIKDVDPELVEFWTLFVLRFQNAPNKGVFLKEALRRALEERRP